MTEKHNQRPDWKTAATRLVLLGPIYQQQRGIY